MSIIRVLFLMFVFFYACKSVNTGASADQRTKAAKKDSLVSQTKPKPSARPVHWSYVGESGPESWGKLSPVYALCQSGEQQSPININQNEVSRGLLWKISYQKSSLKIAHNEHMDDILDNGHTIQVTVDEGSTFTFNHHTYHLKQFHFHTPSEHTLNGAYFPMEVHFVHQSDSGRLAVIALLVEEGKENANFDLILSNLPDKKGETRHLKKSSLNLQFQLPEKIEAFHYEGSLITPLCSEQVEWFVFKHHAQASKKQLQAFAAKLDHNNRPIQALNKRTVKENGLSGNIQD